MQALLAVATIAFLGVLQLGIDKTLNWLLEQEAQALGMDWAHHIQTRLPLSDDADGAHRTIDIARIPTSPELKHMAADVIEVGNIFQIEFIDADCHCDDDTNAGGATHADLHWHGFSKSTVNTVGHHAEPAAGDHVSAQPIVTRHQPGFQTGWNRSPFTADIAVVEETIRTAEHAIFIRTAEGRPAVFAEVLHPVTIGEEVSVVLRVLVDLEKQSALYKLVLYAGTLCVLFLVVLSFWYPATKYLNALTRQRKAYERARYLAEHDVLTGIANRHSFQESSEQMLVDCLAKNETAALIVVDIDNFKEINDYHGHQAGDEILTQVARRLSARFSNLSIVARLGGDEFAVLTSQNQCRNGCDSCCIGIDRCLEMSVSGTTQAVAVSISAGFAQFPRDGENLSEIMRNADLALYSAKRDPKIVVSEYTPAMGEAFQSRLQITKEFSAALNSGQVAPHYQPLVDREPGQVRGFEALARWAHPDRGLLSPGVFQIALEDHDICENLGRVMLDKVLTDMAEWKTKGTDFGFVSLNVTEADLLRPGFTLDVIKGIADHGLLPGELVLEVTEGCVFGNNKDTMLARLDELRAAGCGIGLDDFGTGYSSITHIKELPCTGVKIDKSFIRGVVDDQVDQAIVRALVGLGRSVGFKVIAEGVETSAQLDLVRTLGCHFIQGFYYSPAVAVSDVPALITRIGEMEGVDQTTVDRHFGT